MSVALRPLGPEDGPQVLTWRRSDAVAPYMYSDHQISRDEHEVWLERAIGEGDRRFWVIELDGRGVGLANIARIDPDNARCEWAYYLADPATRGRGVGAIVEYMVLGYVFDRLKMNRLWCEVFVENEAVWRMHESFGFRREALFRDYVRKNGQFRDVIGLAMLAADWPQARAASRSRLAAKGVDLDLMDASFSALP